MGKKSKKVATTSAAPKETGGTKKGPEAPDSRWKLRAERAHDIDTGSAPIVSSPVRAAASAHAHKQGQKGSGLAMMVLWVFGAVFAVTAVLYQNWPLVASGQSELVSFIKHHVGQLELPSLVSEPLIRERRAVTVEKREASLPVFEDKFPPNRA
ncbi:MAG: hypothetical protein SGCHY_002367 [Lobulomycetales sp.]